MKTSTDVLVIGAGPVGLMAALCLRKAGIDVTVIDANDRGEAHSFAVVLHPRTVTLLTNLGITEALLWQGQSFQHLALFSEGHRQALLNILPPNEMARGGLTLPQNVLRRALESALGQAGLSVHYGCRFESLAPGAETVRVRSSSLPRTTTAIGETTGIAPELEARFVVGTDGRDSAIRRALGIAMLELEAPESFCFFDVHGPQRRDAELVIDDLASAIYPVHGDAARYVFQVSNAPEHGLASVRLSELCGARMPWHSAAAKRVEWAGTHRFPRSVAERFGAGRVWLAGDAAHSTSPLGAQSLNVGLREARDLSRAIAECLRGAPIESLGTGYELQRQIEWRRLMGVDPPSLHRHAPEWARRHLRRLLASLPASGDDLDDLLAQLGITLL